MRIAKLISSLAAAAVIFLALVSLTWMVVNVSIDKSPSRDAIPAIASEKITPPNVKAPALVAGQSTPSVIAANHLIIPVVGVKASQLHDTFNEARSEGRV